MKLLGVTAAGALLPGGEVSAGDYAHRSARLFQQIGDCKIKHSSIDRLCQDVLIYLRSPLVDEGDNNYIKAQGKMGPIEFVIDEQCKGHFRYLFFDSEKKQYGELMGDSDGVGEWVRSFQRKFVEVAQPQIKKRKELDDVVRGFSFSQAFYLMREIAESHGFPKKSPYPQETLKFMAGPDEPKTEKGRYEEAKINFPKDTHFFYENYRTSFINPVWQQHKIAIVNKRGRRETRWKFTDHNSPLPECYFVHDGQNIKMATWFPLSFTSIEVDPEDGSWIQEKIHWFKGGIIYDKKGAILGSDGLTKKEGERIYKLIKPTHERILEATKDIK